MHRKTLLIGASPNKNRFSYKAVELMSQYGIEVIPIGVRAGKIAGNNIIMGFPVIKSIHTITLYISQQHQKLYYDYIISLKPKRIIFNPGSENPEFELILEREKIKFSYSCTLLMIVKGEY
jgi:predicted CoA-binding protein